MNQLLTIGTIVRIKKMASGMNMMIVGYYPIEKETETLFEYSGILYPQGFIGERSIFLFYAEDIEEIIFDGYSDEEGKEFRKGLPLLLQTIAEQ